MIDASDEATEQGAGDDDSGSGCPMHQSSDAGPRHKLSNKEIVDISVGLMVAGYDTTSSTLSFTSYLLALHPDIQEKLQSEIDTYYENKPVSIRVCVWVCACMRVCVHVCVHVCLFVIT